MTNIALVTGGGGFIGRHLARLLHERGTRVRVLDIAGAPELPDGIEVRKGSILDAGALTSALEGVECLYHLAANPDLWAARPESFFELNYHGTLAVLEAARTAKTPRVVYTSTESILKGVRRTNGSVIDENSAPARLEDMPGPYCRSKFLAERAAFAAAASGMPIVIVNPTMPIGPGDRHLTPPSRMLLDYLNGRSPAYLDWECNLVDARDAALGHILAAERGQTGENYILGGHNLRFSALLAELERMTGLAMPKRRVPYAVAYLSAVVLETVAWATKRRPVAPLTGVRLAGSPMIFDHRKASAELGFEPRPIAETLRDAIRDFARRNLLTRPVGSNKSI